MTQLLETVALLTVRADGSPVGVRLGIHGALDRQLHLRHWDHASPLGAPHREVELVRADALLRAALPPTLAAWSRDTGEPACTDLDAVQIHEAITAMHRRQAAASDAAFARVDDSARDAQPARVAGSAG